MSQRQWLKRGCISYPLQTAANSGQLKPSLLSSVWYFVLFEKYLIIRVVIVAIVIVAPVRIFVLLVVLFARFFNLFPVAAAG